jgi:glycosyltransferase involved in cell wall biosynthesis
MRTRVFLVALHFAEYSGRLADQLAVDHDVVLVCDRSKMAAEYPEYFAVPDRCSHVWMRDDHLRSKLAAFFSILWRVVSGRPTLTLVHEHPTALNALYVLVLSLFSHVRLIVHDPAPHAGVDASLAAKNELWRSIVRVCASDYAAHGVYCAERLSVLVQDRKPVLRIQHGALSPPGPDDLRTPVPGRVLFFGRLERYKGLETLFAACDLVHARYPQLTLHVLGRGSMADEVAAWAERRPYATLHQGFAPPAAVRQAVQSARVIALPYDEATQSGVLAIAFAHARPVVACAVGGLAELVNQANGALVPPRDPEAFARETLRLLTDDDVWRSASEQAARTAETVMNWRDVARTLTSCAGGVR